MKKLLLGLTLMLSAISFTTIAKETPITSNKASISKTFETLGLDSDGKLKLDELKNGCTYVTYTNPYRSCTICCYGSGYSRSCTVSCY